MFTILGGYGFIGSHLRRHFDATRTDYEAPQPGEPLRGRDLGHVIDCAGITADFRTRPYDTVDAHVSRVVDLVRHCRFERFVYLSSTRIYKDKAGGQACEEDEVAVSPIGLGGLYNLSKLMGEAVTLTLGARGCVARLSNVYGEGSESHNFLASIITDAVTTGRIVLKTSLVSAKDYVGVGDVVALLPRLATDGGEQIYNVASGANVTNGDITAEIARLTGCSVAVEPDSETWVYPPTSIARARREFGFEPSGLIGDLPGLVASYRRGHGR